MADWVTKAEVKLYSGVATADTAKDAIIDANIPRAQAMIEQYILKSGQVFGTFTDVVEKITAPSRSNKIFPRKHSFITTLTSVTEDGDVLSEGEDYEVDLTTGIITRLDGWWSITENGIEIKYSVTNPAPDDIKLALIEYVAVLCGIKSKTFVTSEGIERTVAQGIPDFIKDLLSARHIPRCAMG